MLPIDVIEKAKTLGANGYIIEMYPSKVAGIFAYQFITAWGRNIATYIPNLESFIPQNEYYSQGRRYYNLEMYPENFKIQTI